MKQALWIMWLASVIVGSEVPTHGASPVAKNVRQQIDDAIDKSLAGTGWQSEYKTLFCGLYEHGLAIHKDQKDLYDAQYASSARRFIVMMGQAASASKAHGVTISDARRRADDKKLVVRLKATLALPLYSEEDVAAQQERVMAYVNIVKAQLFAQMMRTPMLALQGFSKEELDEIAPTEKKRKPILLGGVLVRGDERRDAVMRLFDRKRRATRVAAFVCAQFNLFADLYAEEYCKRISDLFSLRVSVWSDDVLAAKIKTANTLIEMQVKDKCLLIDKTLTNVLLTLLFSANLRVDIDPSKQFAMIARPDRIEMNNPLYLEIPLRVADRVGVSPSTANTPKPTKGH